MGGTKPRSQLLKVVLLGDGGVGKSSLMNRFVSNKFDSQSFHTIGVEFLNKEVVSEGQIYTIQIWDTAGQERFKSLRTPFYRGSDCCLLTFAVDEAQSFRNLAMWRQEFLHYSDVGGGMAAEDFPFVVLGNKVDNDRGRVVSKEAAVAWCRQYDMPYYETSAKDAINVDEAFHAAVSRYREMETRIEAKTKVTNSIDLSQTRSSSKECC